MKYLQIFLSIIIIGLYSCRADEHREQEKPLKIGQEDKTISDVMVNPGLERNIILSGGNGKYEVNISDSKIASAKISHDTLKIKGILEGETFATITSHNQKQRLDVKVLPPNISISQSFIQLYPKNDSKVVSISGGNDIVDLKIDDPDKILSVKWNGNTGIVEIFAHYEGDAKIIAISKNVPNKILNIKVRSEGEIKTYGIYSTTNRFIYPAMRNVMMAKRKNVGVWLSASTDPYGLVTNFDRLAVFRFSPIKNPKQGEKITVNVDMRPFIDSFQGMENGDNQFLVDEVRENLVILRTKKSKVALPYDKN